MTRANARCGALGAQLERERAAIARACQRSDPPREVEIRGRLEEAAEDLTAILMSDALTPAGQQTLRAMVFDSCGFVEMAAAHALALDEIVRCCLAWRSSTVETLGRFGRRHKTDPMELARVATLAGQVLDEVLIRICGAVESERERTDEHLRFLATHDPLTGLANRSMISECLERLARRRRGVTLALVFLDLDDFKTVNDTLGHAAGDELLCHVTARLQACVRQTDVIGRLGGDEFVVIVEEATGGQAPELVAQRLVDSFRAPFVLAGGRASLRVTASIGVASSDVGAPAALLRDADLAMYRAKDFGKDRAEVACPLRRRGS